MTVSIFDEVTLFTTCKPFVGAAAIAQRNALASWQALGFQTLVVGDDLGAKAAAQEFGAAWIPDVERSSVGTPLVRSVFEQAENQVETSFLAYINADIILPPEFLSVFEALFQNALPNKPLLLTCRRKNVPISEELADSGSWSEKLAQIDRQYGSWDLANAIDIFVFSKGLFSPIPDFSIGRMSWDNWLLWRARERGALVIDASMVSPLFHPIHGYTDHAGGWREVAFGSESAENRRLSAGHGLDLDQAMTHVMDDGGMITPCSAGSLRRIRGFCRSDPVQEFKAGIAYLLAAFNELGGGAILDTLRTLLWRNSIYFPNWTEVEVEKEQLKAVICQSNSLLAEGDAQRAFWGIQDVLGSSLLTQLNSRNDELYLWGAGAAGRKAQQFLKRHSIPIAGFLDANPGVSGQMLGGVPISFAEEFLSGNKKRISVLITSMYMEEISTRLNQYGFQHGRNFFA